MGKTENKEEGREEGWEEIKEKYRQTNYHQCYEETKQVSLVANWGGGGRDPD